jgi:hypothetical protein
MVPQPTPVRPARRNGQLRTPLGWSDHGTRTVALDAWLAREEAVAAGAVGPADPALLGLPDHESLVRALFQRFTTALEGVLDVELELGDDAPDAPYAAVRAAYRRTAAHRPTDWRALQREAGDPVVDELTRCQHDRIARRAGVTQPDVAAIATKVARFDTSSAGLSHRTRRRGPQRVLARRAG